MKFLGPIAQAEDIIDKAYADALGGGSVAVYDIAAYGAALDGTTNDWSAIQAAVAAAVANGGGVVTAPPASAIAATVTSVAAMGSNVTVDLQGSTITLDTSSSTSMFTVDGAAADISVRNFTVDDPTDTLGPQGVVRFNAFVERVTVDNIRLTGASTTTPQTSSIVFASAGGTTDLTIRRCTANLAGYIARLNDTHTYTRTVLEGNHHEDCGVVMFQLAGAFTTLAIRDNTFLRHHPTRVPTHPINFSDTATCSFRFVEVTGNHIEGRAGLGAQGTANGASGDLLPLRLVTDGLVSQNFFAHGGEVGIDLVGCVRVSVLHNTLTDIDTVGILVGTPNPADASTDCVVAHNLIARCGLDVNGNTPNDYDLAAIRVWDTNRCVVGYNHIDDCPVGVAYKDSTNLTRFGDVISNCPTPIITDPNVSDSLLLPVTLDPDLAYAASTPGTDADYIESIGFPFSGGEAWLRMLVKFRVPTLTPTSQSQVLGAGSGRLRMALNTDGTLFFRFRSNLGGTFEDFTTTGIPERAAARFVCVAYTMDGAAGTIEVEYTEDDITEYADGTWTSIGSGSTDVGQTLHSTVSASVLSIGHQDVGVTSGGNGQADVQLWWGDAGADAGSAVRLFEFDAKKLRRNPDNGYQAASGEQWQPNGTIAVLPVLDRARPGGYAPSNDATLRTFDADTVTLGELADVVATLIKDLGGA